MLCDSKAGIVNGKASPIQPSSITGVESIVNPGNLELAVTVSEPVSDLWLLQPKLVGRYKSRSATIGLDVREAQLL
jgi:hypothetical protein